jgi:hypothetical protein
VGELAVTVRSLVEVHEVHVDLCVREVDVRLRVEVQHRLLQCAEAVDPHLGGRERVHPRDDADAPRVGVDLEHPAMDADRLGQHRLEDNGQRDVAAGVELLHDGGRLIGDLPQRVVAVERLAAGEEPDLAIVVVLIEISSLLPVGALVPLVQAVDVGGSRATGSPTIRAWMNGTGDVLAHHGRFDGGLRRRADGEDAVVAQQHDR